MKLPMPTTADEWVARRLAGACNEEEEAAFQAWLRAAPSNAEEYDVAETLARAPRFLRHFSPDLSVQAFHEALTTPSRKRGKPNSQVDGGSSSKDRGTNGTWLFFCAALVLVLFALASQFQS
jgi:ferric-dicitrate binding protein FerR (iron transport regulator)